MLGSTGTRALNFIFLFYFQKKSVQVLGWSSALASFGAFIIPSILRVAIAEDRVSAIMFGFAAYYLFCFFLNFWFYLRPGTGASLEYKYT